MPTRLAAVAPNLDALLAGGDAARCIRAGLAAAQQAAERCNLSDVAPGLAFTEANLDKIDALARALDDEYLSLDRDATPETKYLAPFARARAASALAFALRREAREAVYEAIIATDDAPAVTRAVKRVLRQDA